jgi:hypothetical protein
MNQKFREVQKFNQWWMWLIYLVILAIPIFAMYQHWETGAVLGDQVMSDEGLLVFFLFSLLFVVFNLIVRMETELNSEGIHLRFRPFLKREFRWDEVREAEVIRYGFVGGWGIRLWTRYGTVYNVSGAMGLVIRLKNGKRLVIGTKKSEEMKAVLGQYFPRLDIQ